MPTYLRTNFRLTGHLPDTTTLSNTGIILQGSWGTSATKSGYITVSNVPLSGTPRTAGAHLVMTAGATLPRNVQLKGIDANYVTFLVTSGSAAITTGSDVTIVWYAYL